MLNTLFLVVIVVVGLANIALRPPRFDGVDQPVWSDVATIVLAVAACFVVIRLLRQQARPRSIPGIPVWLQDSGRSIVETSLFGTGFLFRWTPTHREVTLAMIAPPAPLHSLEVPPQAAAGSPAMPAATGERPRPPAQSRLSVEVQAAPSGGRPQKLVPYEVARGDTYWSLAEETLGDGKRWPDIRAMNMGRQVAEGVFLSSESVLRPGWRIVIPATQEEKA